MTGGSGRVVVASCPVCHQSLGDGDLRRCGICETSSHADCWSFVGGCSRFGCEGAHTLRDSLVRYLTASLDLSCSLADRNAAASALGALYILFVVQAGGMDALVAWVTPVLGAWALHSMRRSAELRFQISRLRKGTATSSEVEHLVQDFMWDPQGPGRFKETVPSLEARMDVLLGLMALMTMGMLLAGLTLDPGMFAVCALMVIGSHWLRQHLGRLRNEIQEANRLRQVWWSQIEDPGKARTERVTEITRWLASGEGS